MDSTNVSASSKGHRSSAATSQSGVTVSEPKWYSILAIVLAAAALIGFELLKEDRQSDQRAWERQFARVEVTWQGRFDAQQQSWQTAYDRLHADLRETKTSAALLERRYIDLQVFAVLKGWKVPADDQHGALGNIERMKGDHP